MDLNPTSIAPTITAKPAQQAGTSLSSDFNTFIQMLTAQARYQDPLQPLDSAQYAAQLAQFSMVEQQVLTNENLAALAGGASELADLAGWVGMDVRSTAPVRYAGDPVEVTPQVSTEATAAFLTVRDSLGVRVARIEIPTDAGAFEWTGRDETGAELPYGSYSLDVESVQAGDVISNAPAETYAPVREAQVNGASVLLVLDSGAVIHPDDVTALRAPAL